MRKLGILFLLLGAACSNGEKKNQPSDTPTTGVLSLIADAAYQPIIDSEISAFTVQYSYAEIRPKYLTEVESWKQFMNDSAKVIVSCRKPSAQEEKYLRSIKVVPKVTPLAYDALAFLMHPSVTDTCLTYDEIRQIVTGEITDWKDVAKGKKTGKIQLVMDNAGGSSARTLKDLFLGKKDFPSTITATQDYQKVIDWVSTHPNSLGVIPVSWVCDPDDPQMVSFLSKIKVAEIAATEVSRDRGEGYQPFQAYMAQKKYPFTREVYAISRQSYAGLALGFNSYMAGPKGQLIFLKSGLLPATQPIRIQSIKQ
jgi:phosphate transport system substrate-binding protein